MKKVEVKEYYRRRRFSTKSNHPKYKTEKVSAHTRRPAKKK